MDVDLVLSRFDEQRRYVLALGLHFPVELLVRVLAVGRLDSELAVPNQACRQLADRSVDVIAEGRGQQHGPLFDVGQTLEVVRQADLGSTVRERGRTAVVDAVLRTFQRGVSQILVLIVRVLDDEVLHQRVVDVDAELGVPVEVDTVSAVVGPEGGTVASSTTTASANVSISSIPISISQPGVAFHAELSIRRISPDADVPRRVEVDVVIAIVGNTNLQGSRFTAARI